MTKRPSLKFSKMDPFETLDQAGIQKLRESLLILESAGFSTRSSPIVVHLNSLIDLCLSIVEELRRSPHERQKLRLNPSLCFDYDRSDELANPLSYKKNIRSKTDDLLYEDNEALGFFISLAEFFVRLKRGNNLTNSFAESFERFLSSSERGQPSKVQVEPTRDAAKAASMAYIRRQIKRAKQT